MTRAQLHAAAEAARTEATQLERQALALREQARMLDDVAAKAPLTIAGNRSMVNSKMEGLDLTGKPEHVRTAGARTRRTSEAKRLLLLAGFADSDVAKALKVGRSTVNAWFSRLAIPRRHAVTLSKPPYGVPLDAWPRIAD